MAEGSRHARRAAIGTGRGELRIEWLALRIQVHRIPTWGMTEVSELGEALQLKKASFDRPQHRGFRSRLIGRSSTTSISPSTFDTRVHLLCSVFFE
jgi:hypothetical protein